MTNTAKRVVQNLPSTPGNNRQMLKTGQTVSIQLCVDGYVDGGKREILGTAFGYADVNGQWTCALEVNDADDAQPGVDPPGSYYTVQEFSKGPIQAFKVPAGDFGTPVQLRDCLITDPALPNVPGGPSMAEMTAAIAAGVDEAETTAATYTDDAIDTQAAVDSGTYALLDFLAQDTDNVYFPAQNAGMVTDLDGTFYFSPGYAAVAKLVADTDGVAYPVAIGA